MDRLFQREQKKLMKEMNFQHGMNNSFRTTFLITISHNSQPTDFIMLHSDTAIQRHFYKMRLKHKPFATPIRVFIQTALATNLCHLIFQKSIVTAITVYVASPSHF